MKNLIVTAIVILFLYSCEYEKKQNDCVELPSLDVSVMKRIDSMLILRIELSDNSVHRFKDGDIDINVVPIYRNDSKEGMIWVNKEELYALDTIKFNNQNEEVSYSIIFTSPKGGDVTLSRVFNINDIPNR